MEELEQEQEQKEPKQRGGFRPNAGRKKKCKQGSIHVGVRINSEYLRIIEDNYNCSRTAFIEAAIKEKLIRAKLI